MTPGTHTLSLVTTGHVGDIATSADVVDVANTGQAAYDTYATRDLPDGYAAGANVATGNAQVSPTDLLIPWNGPELSVTRTYNGFGATNNQFGWAGRANWTSG